MVYIDATDRIQNALNINDVVYLEEGIYEISKPLIIRKSVKISPKDNGKVVIKNNGVGSALVGKAPVRYATSIKKELLKGQRNIEIFLSDDVKKGDLIHIQSDNLWYWDNRNKLYKGELHRISDYNNGMLLLEEEIYDNYDYSENLLITIYEESKLIIENINFINDIARNNIMIQTQGFQESQYIDNNIELSQAAGILLRNNYKSLVKENNISLNVSKEIETGYGIQDYGGTSNIISSNEIYRARRGVDISGVTPSHYAVVEENNVYGQNAEELATGSSGYGSHSTAVNALYRNNYSYGMQYGFVLRGKDDIVENNIVEENKYSFLEVAYGTGSWVKANIRRGKILNPTFLHVFSGYTGETRLISNKAENVTKWFDFNNGKLHTSNNVKI